MCSEMKQEEVAQIDPNLLEAGEERKENEVQPLREDQEQTNQEEVQKIELHLLEDDGSQTRFELDDATVRDYARRITAGEIFDPILAFYDGTRYYRATGGHRLAAHRLAGKERIACVVKSGTLWDAICAGIADNRQHRGRPL